MISVELWRPVVTSAFSINALTAMTWSCRANVSKSSYSAKSWSRTRFCAKALPRSGRVVSTSSTQCRFLNASCLQGGGTKRQRPLVVNIYFGYRIRIRKVLLIAN